MALSPEDTAVLVDLLKKLTPGHVSTIAASLNEAGSQIGTSIGSENYAVLRKLVEWGLAREVPLDIDYFPELKDTVTSFSINEDAKPEIANLLSSVSLS